MAVVDWRRLSNAMRGLVAGSYVLLLLAIAAETLVWPGHGRAPNPTVWIFLSLPLLAVLPGLIRGGVKAHAWLSFIAMFYFMWAVVGLADLGWRLLDIVELVLSIELFVAAMLYVRWRSRALRALDETGGSA